MSAAVLSVAEHKEKLPEVPEVPEENLSIEIPESPGDDPKSEEQNESSPPEKPETAQDEKKAETDQNPSNTMPCDPMDDIELKSIQLQFPSSRTAPRQSIGTISRVPTDHGELQVAVVGDCTKPAILTYHDLGLNYSSSFSAFFNYPSMRALLENFCVYHVTAPGQEEGAPTYPEDYVYPTMDQLAGQLPFVLTHFGLKSVIGFGVGFGANVLARFAIEHPEQVGALCLVNCVSTVSGWIEWGYQKLNARHLKSKGMTQGVVDYLMWHHFGRNTEERNHDLVQVYKNYFEQQINPVNLSMLIDTYLRRTDMNIARSPTSGPQNNDMTLKMPVMNITGSLSPHVDDTVTLNGRLDPKNSTWMKISECGMVLEEQPAKVSEAFRLFLQGEGYAGFISPAKLGLYHLFPTTANKETSANNNVEVINTNQQQQVSAANVANNNCVSIRITENPISEAVPC
ncbi:protein NDRG3-like isoform X2 [Ctenocephalides felis]|uniref:protein NDRG3-like isoform X2 n=1 Tax=Ctenocephalides felis TaxID=7515 RepID=UPI000E6E5B21|nr:protein NDRG3-like isoform X2 [Ctenocephalides felis]